MRKDVVSDPQRIVQEDDHAEGNDVLIRDKTEVSMIIILVRTIILMRVHVYECLYTYRVQEENNNITEQNISNGDRYLWVTVPDKVTTIT